jgi:hypothetical protein
MSLFRAQIPDIFLELLPVLEEVAINQYEMFPVVYPIIFNVESNPPATSFMNKTWIAGTGLFADKTEGEEATTDELYQGYDKKYTYVTRALMVETSKEAADDANKLSLTKEITEALGRSAKATEETHCASVLNNGFTVTTGNPNSEYLFATNHALPRGGTCANRLTNHVDISYTSLQLILNLFDSMQEVSGIYLTVPQRQIIFPKELQWTVHELLKSQYRPDNANMAANALAGMTDLTPVKWLYLTDTDAFFVSAGSGNVGLDMIFRENFNMTSDYDSSKRVGESIGQMRYDYGWCRWYGIVGSAGI